MGSNPTSQKKSPSPWLYFIGTLLLCGLISAAGFSFLMPDASPESAAPKPTNTPGRVILDDTPVPATGSEAAAWTACERFVSDQLKAPSTAEFSGFDTKISDLGNGRYVVRGYVDAENSFGAMIRNDYLCRVEHEKDITYNLLDLEVTPR
jgi:hypothetical protein